MGFRQSVNDWLSIILKGMAIFCIVIGILWIGFSIWGNIDTGKTDPPDIDKAKYVILLQATGQEIYTSDYIKNDSGEYRLNGYYELVKDKWIYREVELLLDEYYYGKIIIRGRNNE